MKPLTLGMTGVEVNKLQTKLLEGIELKIITLDDTEYYLVEELKKELDLQVFGKATKLISDMIADELAIDVTNGIANDFFIADLERKSTIDAANPYKVLLTVVNKLGKPVEACAVTINRVLFRSESSLDNATTNDLGVVEFSFDEEDILTVDSKLNVRFDIVHAELSETFISDVYYNLNKVLNVTISIPLEESEDILDEFTSIQTKLQDLWPTEYLDLNASDAGIVKASIDVNQEFIDHYILALKLNNDSDNSLPVGMNYAILKQFPYINSIDQINLLKDEIIIQTLDNAIQLNIIPSTLPISADTYVNEVRSSVVASLLDFENLTPEAASQGNIITDVFGSTNNAAVMDYFQINGVNINSISFDNMNATLTFLDETTYNDFIVTLGIGSIAGRNPSMIGEIKSNFNASIGESIEYWQDKIEELRTTESDKFVFPHNLVSVSIEDKVEEYANIIKLNLEMAYPTETYTKKLDTDTSVYFEKVKTYLEGVVADNPEFKLMGTSIAIMEDGSMDMSSIPEEERDLFVHEVSELQRLGALSGDFDSMMALKDLGYSDSRSILFEDKEVFVEKGMSSGLSAAKSMEIYVKALDTALLTNVLVIDRVKDEVNFEAIYSGSRGPEWRKLFGNLDVCCCNHCLSVFSPAAYFTDTLEFLRRMSSKVNGVPTTYTISGWLKRKRPDLWGIELSCKNTNIAFPTIDIVNELLEDMVMGSASQKDELPYSMRSLNTTKDEKYLDAIPEYIFVNSIPNPNITTGSNPSTNPYKILMEGVYPWNAPYDFFQDQVKESLNIINCKNFELLRIHSTNRNSFQINDIETACLFLNINGSVDSGELKIMLHEGASVAQTLRYYGLRETDTNFYLIDPQDRDQIIGTSSLSPSIGSVCVDTGVAYINRMDIFMQQTQLSFVEVQELLDCQYTNPVLSYTSFPNYSRKLTITDDPTGTCKTNEMRISGFNHQKDLLKINSFVRLSKKLNWSFQELDMILTMMKVESSDFISQNHIIVLAQLKWLIEHLNCKPTDIIGWWGLISDFPYFNYKGGKKELKTTQYESIFRNNSNYLVSNIPTSTYPYPARFDSNFFNGNTTPINDEEKKYLLGALGISNIDFSYLFDKLKGDFFTNDGQFVVTRSNVSKLRREAMLMKLSKLSKEEYCFLRNVVSGVFFEGSNFITVDYVFQFYQFKKVLKSTNLKFDEYNYLFLDVIKDKNANKKEALGFLNKLKKELSVYENGITRTDNTVDEANLLSKLEKMFNKPDADFIVNTIGKNTNPTDFSSNNFETTEITWSEKFEEIIESKFSNEEKDALMDVLINSGVSFETDSNIRLTYINSIFGKLLRKNIIRDFFSATFKIKVEIAHEWLDGLIQRDPGFNPDFISCYELYSNIEFVLGDPFLESDFQSGSLLMEPYYLYEQFKKASFLVNHFSIGLSEFKLYHDRDTELGIPGFSLGKLSTGKIVNTSENTGSANYTSWKIFLEWQYIKKTFGFKSDEFYMLLSRQTQSSGFTNNQRKTYWFESIQNVSGINSSDLTLLVGPKDDVSNKGYLNISFTGSIYQYGSTNDFLLPNTFIRITENLDLCKDLEIGVEELHSVVSAVLNPENQDVVETVNQMARNKYSYNQWLNVVKESNNNLRIRRRDALIDYLLCKPPLAYRYWINENDVYDSLLMDVKVMPIVKTSRIKQAISSVQTYINRAIMHKEADFATEQLYTLDNTNARQWSVWRKFYRVWEANRKVFVYPENWIEPELRDNKSQLFQEFEKELRKNELTDDHLLDSIKSYISKFDELSHMEVVATTNESITEGASSRIVTHVIARTPSNPHIYYYRRREYNEWTGWEKIESNLDGENYCLVKFKGRLKLFWLEFMEKNVKKANIIKPDKEGETCIYFEIRLCWSEYKHGKWMPKQRGKELLTTNPDWLINTSLVDIKWNLERRYRWSSNWMVYSGYILDKAKEHLVHSIIPYVTLNEDGDLTIAISCQRKLVKFTDLCIYFDSKNRKWASPKTQVTEWDSKSYRYQEIVGAIPVSTVIPLIYFSGSPMSVMHGNEIVTYVLMNAISEREFELAFDDVFNMTNVFEVQSIGSFVMKGNRELAMPNNYYNSQFDYYLRAGLYYTVKNGGYQVRNGYNSNYLTSKIDIPNSNARSLFNSPKNGKFVIDRNTKYIDITGDSLPAGFTLDDAKTYNHNYNKYSYSFEPGNFFYSDTNNTFFIEETPSGTHHVLNFFDKKVDRIMDQIDRKGIDGLFDKTYVYTKLINTPTVQLTADYVPKNTDNASEVTGVVKFDYEDPNSIYYWELFFHIPMLIANKLANDQRFLEAMNWYHYVFNPTNTKTMVSDEGVARYWNFKPFYDQSILGVQDITELMNHSDLKYYVERWANNPFKPHLIARTRVGAYMKNVVMKYLDMLISWGDMLFRRDTMESINEATIMYVLASNILGRKPICLGRNTVDDPKTYQYYEDHPNAVNAFGNLKLSAETLVAAGILNQNLFAPPYNAGPFGGGVVTVPPPPVDIDELHLGYKYAAMIDYFCIPQNEKLLSYWGIVADRLFKIRNSQNIDGVERQLALFEPPIDPALLVKAAASGLSIADAINAIYTPLPEYRFVTLTQKATELIQELKSMGASMLAALEKKDAEMLSLLRNTHELSVLELTKEIKLMQVRESEQQIQILSEQRGLTETKLNYYNQLISGGLNDGEKAQLISLGVGIGLRTISGVITTLGSAMYSAPDAKIGGPFTIGITFGGTNIGSAAQAVGDAFNTAANVNDILGSMFGIQGNYARRKDEWKFQSDLAKKEIKQIDKQILSAQIRNEITQKEFDAHTLQIQNTMDMDVAMHAKFTNEDLYDWMIGEISDNYFQAYKLAFDLAKKAERTYHYELGIDTAQPFIQYGYWDSLKKGLLSGDKLMMDVKRMEVSYLNSNKRLHELTKHISLSSLNPKNVFEFKNNKKVSFDIPEWLFDLDYPGHYMRRIKSISISIPCVAGPYTTIAAKLTLNSSKYRKNTLLPDGYAEQTENDSRFEYIFGGGQSIATSSAQNDSGMFELNFRDERYLPFEGCGAISSWTLEIPSIYTQFDINSISDVIIHMNYTAKYDKGLTNDSSFQASLIQPFSLTDDQDNSYLPAMIDIPTQFNTEWEAYIQDIENEVSDPQFTITISHKNFPLFANKISGEIKHIAAYLEPSDWTSMDDFKVLSVDENFDDLICESDNAISGYSDMVEFTSGTLGIDDSIELNLKISIGTDPITVALLRKVKHLYLIPTLKLNIS